MSKKELLSKLKAELNSVYLRIDSNYQQIKNLEQVGSQLKAIAIKLEDRIEAL